MMKRQKQWTCEEKLSRMGLFGLEQRRLEEDLMDMYKYLLRGG